MFAGHGGQLIIRAFYFVIIARALGAHGYGAFVGVTALVAIASPFSGWGSGGLLIRSVTRDPTTFREQWGKALLLTAISASALFGIVIAVARAFLPAAIPFTLIAAVAFSDLFFFRLIDIGAQTYQAFERLDRTAVLRALPSLARLVGAALMLLTISDATPVQWGGVYLATTVFSAGITVHLVNRELGRPKLDIGNVFAGWKDGFFFALSLSAQSVYNEIDKTMLARLATLDAAGIYAAAYRLISVAVAPVRSILYAAYSRFFVYGAEGINGSIRYAKKLLPIGIISSLVPAVLLYVFAPIIPSVLGDDYIEAVDAIRWLAFLPLLKAGHYFAADGLTGADHQAVRSIIQVVVGLVNAILNLVLIPKFSWRGAAIASLVSDGLLAVLLWGAIWLLHWKARSPHPAMRPVPLRGRESVIRSSIGAIIPGDVSQRPPVD